LKEFINQRIIKKDKCSRTQIVTINLFSFFGLFEVDGLLEFSTLFA